MKSILAICILVAGAVVGCGSGPTAVKDANPTQVTPVVPRPTPNPVPCRPYPKCQG